MPATIAKFSSVFCAVCGLTLFECNGILELRATIMRNIFSKGGNVRTMANNTTPMKIAEIADALGISKTTVSRALSGKGRVGEETRARVFAYAGLTGREVAPPHPVTQGATPTLSLIIPTHFIRLDLPFLRKCMGGICAMAAQRGYDLLLCYVSETDTDQLERQLASHKVDGAGKDDTINFMACQLASHKVDGVILSRTMSDDPCIDLLNQYGVPFVAIGRIDDPEIPQADNDQLGAACEMTRLLLQLGTRRIAYLGGSGTYTVNADRLRGYLRGLAEFGVQADQTLIHTGLESDEQRTDALEATLERRPDCLLCCDDRLAFDVVRELRARHIHVPQDIRVASLYDSELLVDITPSISAVQFDAERIGSTACRMLLDILAGKDVPKRQLQGYQVILRDSTK